MIVFSLFEPNETQQITNYLGSNTISLYFLWIKSDGI